MGDNDVRAAIHRLILLATRKELWATASNRPGARIVQVSDAPSSKEYPMATALIIRPDSSTELRDVEPDLLALQAVVAGYIEAITCQRAPRWTAYFNEEGKLIPLPANPLATAVVRRNGVYLMSGDTLTGTVIFFGLDDRDQHCDIPPRLTADVQNLAHL